MTKTIDTVVEDIYAVLGGSYIDTPLEKQKEVEALLDSEKEVGRKFTEVLRRRIFGDGYQNSDGLPEGGKRGTLRASKIGVPCERQLWYSVNKPDSGEVLLPSTYNKFTYGDLLELSLLEFVKASGHRVEGEQDELEIHGVKGHRDLVLDGVTCDIKSASAFSFKRFKNGLKPEEDSFGYLTQLGFYVAAAKDDPLVTEKNKGVFLVQDKTSGEICLDVHTFTDEQLLGIVERVGKRKEIVNSESLPERGFSDVDHTNGNRKLGVNCSYCAYKFECWDKLSMFVHKTSGPLYLTHVNKVPKYQNGSELYLAKKKGF